MTAMRGMMFKTIITWGPYDDVADDEEADVGEVREQEGSMIRTRRRGGHAGVIFWSSPRGLHA